MTETPRLIIDCAKLVHNYLTLKKQCDLAGIAVTVVLKGTAGDQRIFRALHEAGLDDIGDSRLQNLSGFSAIHKTLLRLPALSVIREVLNVSDTSLNSEIETIRALDNLAAADRIVHTIMLMVDLGDAREGFKETDIDQIGTFCRSLKKIRVTGIGSNFSCFAGVKPTPAKLERLVAMGEKLRNEFSLPIALISGGNSSSLPLLFNRTIPPGINHLRIGEAILLGRETLNGSAIPGLYQNAFLIEAEILQAGPTSGLPNGEIGFNAFGQVPSIPEVEYGYRALVNLGEQDTPLKGLNPITPEVEILGGSSDYMVVASQNRLKIGERIRFIPNYWSLLTAMSVKYVKKEYVSM